MRRPARDELVDDRIAEGDAERGRLDDGQRPQILRPQCCREQRDDAAVRVSDEVRSRLDPVLEPCRLVLEVDAVERWVRWEAPPVGDDELELLGERALAGPRRRGADNAPVDEQDARAVHTGDRTVTECR